MLLPGLHYGFSPLGIGRAGTYGDLQHLILVPLCRIHIENEAAVHFHQAHVVVGRHRPAAVPALVADAEESDFVGLRMSVGGTLFGKGRRRRGGHVLQPLGGLLRRAGADVDGDVRRAADLLDEIHELIGAKGIVSITSPQAELTVAGRCRAGRSLCASDTGRRSSRPASGRWALSVLCSAATTSLRMPRVFGIGDSGPNPDALVEAVAEILGKLSEEVAIDLRAGF